MLRYARFAVPSVLSLTLLLAGSTVSFGQSVPLITEPVNEAQRVVLRGNTRPEAIPANDRGAVDDSFPLNGIELLLKRSPEHEQAAVTLADELQRRGAPQFHKWLTAEQYAEQFGVHAQDIAAISQWLRRYGFTVDDVGSNRMTITFSGSAGQVKEAFGTEIHRLEVKGQRHFANMSDPSIPAALAPACEGIVSLNDFRPHSVVRPKAQYTFPGVSFPFYAVVPADLATIYDFSPLFALGVTGQGQTIALIEDSDVYNPDDWNTFRKTFGLDVYKGASFETLHPGNGCSDPGVNLDGDDSEAILDAEWASAAAPSAGLQLVACSDTDTTWGGLIAIQNLISQRQAPAIISISYANCEVVNGATANAAYKQAYQQAVLEGVSVFVAAGDNGAAMCDYYTDGPVQSGVTVSAFASTEYNVAVGGSDFGDFYAGTYANYWSATNGPTYGSALSYVPEIPWNDTCASTLLTNFEGYETSYGINGLCGSALGSLLLYPWAGGGGPSNCATGESTLGVIPPTITINFPTPANGSCRGWKKPAWQKVLGNPNDGVRDLPDVSMFAANGLWDHAYIYCNSDPLTGNPCLGAPDSWSLSGGTSFATPIMAGIQALINEVWGGRQGNPDAVYYTLANFEYGSKGNENCETFATGGPAATCIFHDITIGDNDVDCTSPYNCFDPDANLGVPGVLSLSDSSYQPAFKAGVGWDFATGLGSVNAFNLVLNPIWFFADSSQ
jgi:subtilase family serine protease